MDIFIKVTKSIGVLVALFIAWFFIALAQPYLPELFLAAPFAFLLGAIGYIYDIFTKV